MASWATHLMIADRILEDVPQLRRHEFCVGNIAPDCNRENEDWTAFTPPKAVTHWMADAVKRHEDAERFLDEYVRDRWTQIQTGEELSCLLGYYAHLVADAEYQRYIREPKRVAAAWKRVLSEPQLARQARSMEPGWDAVKLLIPKQERMCDIHLIEAEYLDTHPDCGYLTEIRGLSEFPDYIGYLPTGSIVRKVGIMAALPKKRRGRWPFVAISRNEYETYLSRSTALVIEGILPLVQAAQAGSIPLL